ncbi:hypothetical protein L596_016388 [Steinernema carpocapsae]|uniref:Serine protease K12H4.7 n=2 Tax=Steinernema carpocapsae TaxID=34508 RepID=A0A4U5NIW6_STECR|nr:hypothetical protein L596_016388 [Steinernema carpocapsae]
MLEIAAFQINCKISISSGFYIQNAVLQVVHDLRFHGCGERPLQDKVKRSSRRNACLSPLLAFHFLLHRSLQFFHFKMRCTILIAALLGIAVSARPPSMIFGRPHGGFLRNPHFEETEQKPWLCQTKNTKNNTVCGYGNVTQLVDHFNSSNKDTWQQRYQFNMQYYKEGSGLVFFMLGGESAIDGASEKWAFNENITFITWAAKHGAAIFQAEHRFFGTSRPKPDQTTKNIIYLTVEQALEDYSHFIDAMNAKFKFPNPRWMTFGGSYPGSLSAWFRATYPKKTIGAVSTSSAVNVFTDYYGYVDNVQKNIRDVDPNCEKHIREGFNKMISMMYTPDGPKQLKTQFGLCDDFPSPMTPKASQFFFQNIYGVFQGINQYTKDNKGLPRDTLTLENMCGIVNKTANPVAAVYAVVKWNNDLTNPGCIGNSYANYVKTYGDGSYDHPDVQEARSWIWLTCTALGYSQTTDGGNNGIFGSTVPADFFTDQCIDLFGPTYNAAYMDNSVLKYRKKYGGAQNYKGTKCVFPNGSYDPWKDLGLQEQNANARNEVYAMWIEKGAHCSDMYPALDDDSQSLQDARKKIEAYVDQFVSESETAKKTSNASVTAKVSAVLALLVTLTLGLFP